MSRRILPPSLNQIQSAVICVTKLKYHLVTAALGRVDVDQKSPLAYQGQYGLPLIYRLI